MGGKVARPDLRIAEVARKQHGVVSIDQLRRFGLSEKAIARRVAGGLLHRVHRGVYAVGHSALATEGRCLAAVLALGGEPRGGGLVLEHWGAAISHLSALSLWNLLPVSQAPTDVIVSGNGGRARRDGIRVHRSLSLGSGDVTLHRGIPVTTPARTIADLREAASARRRSAISGRELRKAIRQANVLGLPISDRDARVRTRSDLEDDFLRLCRRHRLPPPEVNVRIGPYLVDFLWRERRLVVETDSYIYHRGEVAFQDDHARDLNLMRRGFEVSRLSELQLNEESAQVAEALAKRLAQAGYAAQ
ncbi:MAG TPA: type IV toxin-antitoxin system AbiEi family antitoxin domain-containing protein [Solirubrobacterales bacterium]|jgi:very-short-patch-repair endonuclease|nr:type IV toxin-antitoxin system AbiEi family antitoxin domain-containing protein [Solirubrobacterales bacterium]